MMQGADVIVGGDANTDDRYIAPTVLGNVKKDDPIMKEEIFGPILPVIKVIRRLECTPCAKRHCRTHAIILRIVCTIYNHEIIYLVCP